MRVLVIRHIESNCGGDDAASRFSLFLQTKNSEGTAGVFAVPLLANPRWTQDFCGN
jgi:hypothetical protein